MKNFISYSLILYGCSLMAQSGKFRNGLQLYLSEDSSTYLKATLAIQNWIRYTDNNPGTQISKGGYQTKGGMDIGIRRARLQLFGQVHKRIFVYTQFGINSFDFVSDRKQGAFFHDLVTEFTAHPQMLSIGTGLTGWSGISRYASPSIATTLTADAPLYQQSTNDVTDQFLRKFSVYAKGKIKRLDYRIVISKPMLIQKMIGFTSADTTLSKHPTFLPKDPNLQYHGYVNYQFVDQESNTIPYFVGNYLGAKRVLNIGAGILYQNAALRFLNENNDTLYHPMVLATADIIFDYFLNEEKRNSITFYGAFSHSDFGKNYYRNFGVMNTALSGTGISAGGNGNAFPCYGTGNTIYIQGGYKFRNKMLKDFGTLQVVAGSQYSIYEAFKDPVWMWEGGINWLVASPAKISINYQSRPVFKTDSKGDLHEVKSARRGMLYLQFQIAI